nr:hypothetical protein AIIDPAOG_00080 [Gallid alphaherpesvirus 2]
MAKCDFGSAFVLIDLSQALRSYMLRGSQPIRIVVLAPKNARHCLALFLRRFQNRAIPISKFPPFGQHAIIPA